MGEALRRGGMGFRLRPGLWESLNGGVYGSLLEKFQRVGFCATLPSMDVADVYDMDFRQRVHDLCKRKHPDGSPSRSKSFLADRDSRISLAIY